MQIAACQLNPTVGAIDANCDAIIAAFKAAVADGAHVVAFGELGVCGYPPEDLLLKEAFVAAVEAGLQRIAAATADAPGVLLIVGAVERRGERLYNTAALCRDGDVVAQHHKRHLPNYAVFDEHRWFDEGEEPVPIVEVDGVRIAAVVCEDVWVEGGPMPGAANDGADLIVVVNGSPYARGRIDERLEILRTRVAECGRPVLYVNQVGGQDELIFDGGSFALNADGALAAMAPQLVEHTLTVTFDEDEGVLSGPIAERRDELDEVYDALVLATRDYINKNGFGDVVLTLSGGIDSSLVSAIAADALGPERVHVVAMPSRYSSPDSEGDAEKLARNFGIDFLTIPIEPAHATLMEMLAPTFGDRAPDLTEENLQSRIRGVLVMALSNKLGWTVLTCGNKSESAVGYSTLYGDTAGGFAVIKDCLKLLVYQLAQRRNERAGFDVIPANVLAKPPSAELRPGQRDDQSLPPYDILDPILERYVEHDASMTSIVADGFDEAVVRRIVGLVDRSEYKRRQTPLGPRITGKAFGRDRRVPITNRFSG